MITLQYQFQAMWLLNWAFPGITPARKWLVDLIYFHLSNESANLLCARHASKQMAVHIYQESLLKAVQMLMLYKDIQKQGWGVLLPEGYLHIGLNYSRFDGKLIGDTSCKFLESGI